MATIMFAWQLGGGMGHLMQMLPLARGLSARGHTVFVAVKDVARAAALYGDAGVRFLQAPMVNRERPRFFRAPVTLAHVMGNTDFGHRVDLHGGAAAWRNLFRLTRPDLIVFDHAPLALLAARGVGARRALIGTGFFCPPDVRPLPAVRCRRDLDANPELADPARLSADEDAVLANANWMLGQWKAPPLDRLGQLYGEVDECFLTTFRELDHCPDRPEGARFWGPVNGSGGAAPEWPDGKGRRAFAYLKPYQGIEHLLGALRDRACPTLVYSDSLGGDARAKFETDTLWFARGRVDPRLAACECDLGVLNGTHGTTCDMLLAGRPTLQVPLHGEQETFAEAVCRLGAAEWLPAKGRGRAEVEAALDRLLGDGRYAAAAGAFAATYRDFDPARQRAEMLARAVELLPRGRGMVGGVAGPMASPVWVGVSGAGVDRPAAAPSCGPAASSPSGEGNGKAANRIPDAYHFVFGFAPDFGGKPFSLVHYLAVASCAAVNRPGVMNFYYEHEPSGAWWERARPLLNLVRVEAPREVFGRPIRHVAHAADVFRLDVLRREGGVYLDLDVICLRPLAPLLRGGDEVVMGEELGVGLCNAVILARPGARFLERWREGYRSFDPAGWNAHSVRLPGRLAKEGAGPIRVLGPRAFFWPTHGRRADLERFFRGAGTDYCGESYSVHLWEQITWEPYLSELTAERLEEGYSEFCHLAKGFLPRTLASV